MICILKNISKYCPCEYNTIDSDILVYKSCGLKCKLLDYIAKNLFKKKIT